MQLSFRKLFQFWPVLLLAIGLVVFSQRSTAQAVNLPDADMQAMGNSQVTEQIVLAGGCFWGVQGVFQHVQGVQAAISGYAGGAANTAQYETVSTGTTGHAEAVQITYDPKQISLGQLLKIYFSVAHDPTELNYQGPDHGTQYRSTIFYQNAAQQQLAQAYIQQLDKAKVFNAPIVTTLEPLTQFYAAEDYHQNYLKLHPNNPYIMMNDAPKVAALQKAFPALYLP